MASEFIPPVTKDVEVIPKELKDQWGSAQACSETLALFDQGYFSARHFGNLPRVMAWLAKLHETIVDQALQHPQAHMITELKAELDKRKDANNGSPKKDH